MTRGFTLLELLITLVILSLLLSVAAPSVTAVSSRNQMKSFAHEMSGFMAQARSEAIWRHQDLWAHIDHETTDSWWLRLTDSNQPDAGEVVLHFPAERYRQLILTWTYSANKIKFSGQRGRIKSGSLTFYSAMQPNTKLKIATSFGGNRVIVCGVDASHYGFPACE
ncbi:GspH/FimT family pseudopilin [Vibrio sp. JPW-9-11-11]|uniref:GspH/FimT family pseudopilin n=1 Tax=Vibrio sp. JPW-9-11-11 TaxID=1416532 RepID=UPI001593E7F3|nr:GspH/FimT family pseudopilin [Vibrio sp. JPW-9-11-11]